MWKVKDSFNGKNQIDMLATSGGHYDTIEANPAKMTTSNGTYAIGAKGLKLNTAKDVESIIAEMNAVENLTEVIFSGNTVGVEAGRALAAALKNKTSLKVYVAGDTLVNVLQHFCISHPLIGYGRSSPLHIYRGVCVLT